MVLWKVCMCTCRVFSLFTTESVFHRGNFDCGDWCCIFWTATFTTGGFFFYLVALTAITVAPCKMKAQRRISILYSERWNFEWKILTVSCAINEPSELVPDTVRQVPDGIWSGRFGAVLVHSHNSRQGTVDSPTPPSTASAATAIFGRMRFPCPNSSEDGVWWMIAF